MIYTKISRKKAAKIIKTYLEKKTEHHLFVVEIWQKDFHVRCYVEDLMCSRQFSRKGYVSVETSGRLDFYYLDEKIRMVVAPFVSDLFKKYSIQTIFGDYYPPDDIVQGRD